MQPTAPPTIQPTVPPTIQPTLPPTSTIASTENTSICTSNDSLNVAFLLDNSGSVDATEWAYMRQLVIDLIERGLSNDSYAGIYAYSEPRRFGLIQDYTSRQDIDEIIAALERRNLGCDIAQNATNPNAYARCLAKETRTWDAMNRLLDDQWLYRFQCDDNCEDRQDVIVLITDGDPDRGCIGRGSPGRDPPCSNEPDGIYEPPVCPDLINRLNQTNAEIIVVGIGQGVDGSGDPIVPDWAPNITCLDYADNGLDVHWLPFFNSSKLDIIEPRIREKICAGLYPGDPNGRKPENGTQWFYPETGSTGPLAGGPGSGGGGGAGRPPGPPDER